MNSTPAWRNWTTRVGVAGSMLAAATLNLVATSRGPGLSNDSPTYLAAGESLFESHELANLDGSPLTLFPPGMSVLVAVGRTVGLSSHTTARLVVTASFVGIVYLAFQLLRRVVRSEGIALGGTVLCAVSPTLLGISKMALTEAPFIVIVLILLLLLEGIQRRKEISLRELGLTAGLVWLAFAFRYAGLSLIPVGVVVILFAKWDRHPGRWAAGFVALSLAAPLAWILRNYSADGTFLGSRIPSPDSSTHIAKRIATVLGDWLLKGITVGSRTKMVSAALLLVLLAAFVVKVRSVPREGAHARLLALFVTVHVAYLGLASLSTAIDEINNRLMSPVLVPLLVLTAMTCEFVLTRIRIAPKTLAAVATTLFALVTVHHLDLSIEDARASSRRGTFGYTMPVWQDSELADAVANSVDDQILWSNSPQGLWSATGALPIHTSPRKVGVRGHKLEGQLEQFAKDVACAQRPVLLAWYTYGDPRSYTVEELQTVTALRPVLEVDDGVLYTVSPLADSEACGDTIA